MKMNSCIVELPTTNLDAALSMLEQLGFKTAWQFESDFASVYGGADIEIYLRSEKTAAPHRLYLGVDDADAFHTRYAEHVEVVEPLRDTPWGMREFTIRIFDGHLLRVGHGLQSTREIDSFSHPDRVD